MSEKNGKFNFFGSKDKEGNKIILVTGGAGFIGSNFIRYMLDKYPQYKIINFDKLTYAGNLNNLSMVENNPNYVFVKGDVAEKKDVKNVFEEFEPDFVIHFAAESHVDKSIINPEIFLFTNVLGTQIVLNFAREHNVMKFILISTDEVYGSLGKKGSWKEESSISPNNPYAASKAAADLLIRVGHQTYGQRVNIIRSCNNYGSYQFPEKLIPLMIYNTLHDLELPVFGDGKYVRSWLHVRDHCRAIDLVMHSGKTGEIYNVGSDDEWENLKLVEFILQKLGKPKSLIQYVIDRPGHDFRYSLDYSKIKNELGWKPQIKFEDGLEQTILWYKSHLDWVEDIYSGEYTKYYQKVYEQEI